MPLKSIQTIFVLLFVIGTSLQIQAQSRNRCPAYMWDIEYLPVSWLGFEKSPAFISFTESPGREVEGNYQTRIGFRNASDETVTSLKFDWLLFYKNDYQNTQTEDRASFLKKITLSRGDILINDTGELKSKDELAVLINLPCDKIYENVGNVDTKELIKNKNELIMEFIVTEITYKNGSNWQRK